MYIFLLFITFWELNYSVSNNFKIKSKLWLRNQVIILISKWKILLQKVPILLFLFPQLYLQTCVTVRILLLITEKQKWMNKSKSLLQTATFTKLPWVESHQCPYLKHRRITDSLSCGGDEMRSILPLARGLEILIAQ